MKIAVNDSEAGQRRRRDYVACVLRGEGFPIAPWLASLLAVAVVALSAAARLAGPAGAGPFVTFYPALALCALLLDAPAVVLAAALSAGAGAAWFLPRSPQGAWTVGGWVPLAMFLGSGALLSALTYLTRRNAAQVRENTHQIELAASVFENSQEGILIASADGRILEVNEAFTRITGYGGDEVVGRTTAMLRSNRHDEAFFQERQETLERTGKWMGEIWKRRKNGEVYPEWLTMSAVRGPGGRITHYISTLIDISQRKAAEDEIKHLAFYDPLTRLPNRRLLADRLHQAMSASDRSGSGGALLFIDLDNFKTLNDSAGHDKGDELLKLVAQRLQSCVRDGDTVARFGGDEFVVMLQGLGAGAAEVATQTKIVGDKIQAALNQPYRIAGHEHHSTSSVGATLFSGNKDSVDVIFKQADLAMYQAKQAGRNTLRFFDQGMQSVVNDRAALEAALRQALGQEEFVLYYQPQVDRHGGIGGVEALLRWRQPQRGLVLPGQFIGVAEEAGIIVPLGEWVLRSACEQLRAWARQPEFAQLSLAVNVSARQFKHHGFVPQVLEWIGQGGVGAGKLRMEITESLLLDDAEDVIGKMEILRERGVSFALDDFGTGYSSLSYLKRLPLDQLKIDRSFVRDILTDPNDAVIAQTIVALAHSLGLAVMAEGVENQGQRDLLARQGCHLYQGFLFGKPLPLAEFEAQVRQLRARTRVA
jgi:diguanylate cyclase (GGDEF)-like protein/PAS domain S-box-containing protein